MFVKDVDVSVEDHVLTLRCEKESGGKHIEINSH
jgi:hypothetical protein